MKGKEKETEPDKRRSLGEGYIPGYSRSRQTPVDPEGNPDIWKMAVQTLKEKEGQPVSLKIKEMDNIEWRVLKKHLATYLETLNLQPSWVPRVGELVMWIPYLQGELRYNEEKGVIQMYDPEKEEWLGTPEWRAGTVGQVPDKDPVVMQDIENPTKKEWGVNYSGFRIETFPDPNSDNKDHSLQYRYVHLNSIKPFNYYQFCLSGISETEWHVSILFALTVMSSFSLLGKNAFMGFWPHASIYCSGIWIGAELYVVGDGVRLKPLGYSLDNPVGEVTDVMIISDIHMDLNNCIDDPKSSLLCEKHTVRLDGKIYTLSPERAYRAPGETGPPKPISQEEMAKVFKDVGMAGWGSWYLRHDPNLESQVSQDMVIGRLFDPEALKLYMQTEKLEPSHLGLDLFSVIYARWFSRQRDDRIPEGKHWFWGDYRTQSLALDSLNGEDVGKYSDARLPKMWRAILKCLDGKYTKNDLRDAMIPMQRGRQPGSKSSFAEVGKTSSLVSSGLGGYFYSGDSSSSDEDDDDDDGDSEEEDDSDDDEEEEEDDEDSIAESIDDIPFA
ncbi:hypothetical protein NFIA_019990 [Paecilomyces variotii No. 5]|uniref:Cryptic loci regulator 2 C-terminal domain-containing protein n=1 Tax=Byssochlamys spectabilis (strain No. 5 / NBRC 109023) TaxID=1356009 RepID=V5F9H9_BYSSN|nr:hypothetical protein NFIA_019990 [Paecilomyces variotii No. 5]